MEPADFVLCRHAESEYNAKGLINADPSMRNPLSARGREQATQLRSRLDGAPFQLCVTSALQRAIETATIALKGTTVPVIAMSDLNEPMAGAFEDGPVDTYNDWFIENGLAEQNPSGGESQLDGLARFVRAFGQLSRRPERPILVIAHGLPLAWLREGLLLSKDPEHDVTLAFKDPGIELATPYPYSRDEVAAATRALGDWLHPLTSPR